MPKAANCWLSDTVSEGPTGVTVIVTKAGVRATFRLSAHRERPILGDYEARSRRHAVGESAGINCCHCGVRRIPGGQVGQILCAVVAVSSRSLELLAGANWNRRCHWGHVKRDEGGARGIRRRRLRTSSARVHQTDSAQAQQTNDPSYTLCANHAKSTARQKPCRSGKSPSDPCKHKSALLRG